MDGPILQNVTYDCDYYNIQKSKGSGEVTKTLPVYKDGHEALVLYLIFWD